jgi:hypothetical protein
MTTRRIFLRNSAIAAAGLTFAPSVSGSMKGFQASDKINIGVIGCNGQGWSDLSAFLENPQTDCIALCDVDDAVLNRRASNVERSGEKSLQIFIRTGEN